MRRLITTLALLLSIAVEAREVHNLNDDWRLFPASKSSGDDAYTISLPHCWGEDPTTPSTLTNANYIRSIYAPGEWADKRIFIKFNGVQSISDLFVNGEFVGEHRGGSTAFSFEITDKLNLSEDNQILMKVSSASQNDVLPTSIEHKIYGGIYRDVELIVTPRVAISPIFYASDGVFVSTTSVRDSKIEGEVVVRVLSKGYEERSVDLSIADMSGEVCFSSRINKAKINGDQAITIPFSSKKLLAWSPDSPTLYRVSVSLSPLDSETERGDKANPNHIDRRVDKVTVTTGFRCVTTKGVEAKNRALCINDKPYLMRGVSLYHDHPIEGGVLSEKSHLTDIRIIRDMGANAIRSAITPHDQALYSICDRDGIMAWVDIPFARSTFFSDVAYFPTQRFMDNGVQQLHEIIYQNYNHPSVMMWGIFSLLTTRGDNSLAYIKRLNELAKSIDTTRPTVALSNQNGDLNNVSDLIVWLQNLGWEQGALSDIELWQELIHSSWGHLNSAVMFGEKGVTYHQIDRSDISRCRVERRNGWYPEARQSEMHEEYMKALSQDSLFWGLWSPAMFDFRSPRSDIGESATGFVTFDRAIRKDSYYLYRSLWNKRNPTLHIADRRGRLLKDSLMSLRVYASDTIPPVAYIKGDSVEMTYLAPAQYILDSIIVKGRTKILVKQGNLADSVTFIEGSPLKAKE